MIIYTTCIKLYMKYNNNNYIKTGFDLMIRNIMHHEEI